MRQPCPYCGTLTGLHGFAFDENGSYHSTESAMDLAGGLTEEEKSIINQILEAKGCDQLI